MKVMLTGGAGYFGSHLVPALLKAGIDVKVIDSLIFGNQGLTDYIDMIELIKLDIRDLQSDDLIGIDVLIHLAAISNDPTAEYDPVANKAINFDATISLAKMAKENKVRKFIFASSCSVYYSEQPNNDLCDESYKIAPQAPYSWSKRQAEIALLDLADKDFCPVVLRKGTIFGYSKRMRFDLVVNTFTRDAFEKGYVNVNAEGKMWRPMLYINDAVNVYLAMLMQPDDAIRGQIFNVLSDNYQVIEIAREVQKVFGNELNIDIKITKEGSSRSYRVDGSKLHNLLGITHTNTIGEAVVNLWNVLKKGIDYNSDLHYNIRWLEHLHQNGLYDIHRAVINNEL